MGTMVAERKRTTEESAIIDRFFADARRSISAAQIGEKLTLVADGPIESVGLFCWLQNGIGASFKQDGNTFVITITEVARKSAQYHENKRRTGNDNVVAQEFFKELGKELRTLASGEYYRYELPRGVDVRGFVVFAQRGGCSVTGPTTDDDEQSESFGREVFEVEKL